MTGQTVSTLTCDRVHFPRVDGMEPYRCGHRYLAHGGLDAARSLARRAGWAHRGQHDYCSDCA